MASIDTHRDSAECVPAFIGLDDFSFLVFQELSVCLHVSAKFKKRGVCLSNDR